MEGRSDGFTERQEHIKLFNSGKRNPKKIINKLQKKKTSQVSIFNTWQCSNHTTKHVTSFFFRQIGQNHTL